MASSTRLRSPSSSAAKGTTVPGSSSGCSRGNRGRVVGSSSGFTWAYDPRPPVRPQPGPLKRSVHARGDVRGGGQEVEREELGQPVDQLRQPRGLQQGLLLGGGEGGGLGQEED